MFIFFILLIHCNQSVIIVHSLYSYIVIIVYICLHMPAVQNRLSEVKVTGHIAISQSEAGPHEVAVQPLGPDVFEMY